MVPQSVKLIDLKDSLRVGFHEEERGALQPYIYKLMFPSLHTIMPRQNI
jgi:hypothetical protein